ncbi:MAG: outer rane autotransporter barrel domain protein [Pedosphaera sp.]|nr:outer rane autotransporter barrel domain protein [Pedosphaera sp.]
MALIVSAASASAVDLTWDAGNTSNGGTIDPADGNWDATTINWNNGSGNAVWPQNSTTAPTTGAIFGGADGTYAINVASQIAVTNIIFNNSGYTLSGSPIYFSTNAAAQNSAPIPGINVADGKTASFNVNVAGFNDTFVAGPVFRAGNGSTLNIGGSMGGFQPFFYGPGTNNITAATFGSSVTIVHGPVVYNGGGNWNVGSSLLIGYVSGPTYFGTANTAPGSITFNGGTMTDGASKIVIGRNGGTGTFTLNAGTVNFWINDNGNANSIIAIPNNDAGLNHGTLLVNGGTLNIGGPSSATANRDQIQMMSGGGANGATAYFTQTGGVVNDWGGILIGNTGNSTYAATCTAAITNSGGSLYLGSYGIVRGATFPTVIYIQLSGGIVGALANWSSTLPMDLDTLNGNISFQCADSGGTAHNISLSGALTGPGGLTKTGGGPLKLSGANNYAGTTVVSNGILQIVTGTLPTAAGPLTLDGTAGGSPTYSVSILNTAQYTTNNGDLTYAAGATTADFNYNSFIPSSVVASIQVSGNVNYTATPSVTIEGSAIPVGKYPLIKYGGSVTGTMPTAPTSLPASTTAIFSNSITTKTIYLVVTASPVTASLTWGVGSGIWDINTTANWKQFSSSVKYTEPNAVLFDDSAAGPFPITITNNSTVTPTAITASTTNAYTLTGNGAITGSASLALVSSGTLTMSGTNTYTGGTLIAAGQLNINYGGDGSLNSAIGTGPLTNDLGSKLDNTSGHAVTLLTPIAQYWNDDWTFVGSTNFNTGPGAVTLGNNNVVLTVVSNNLEVDGPIGDGGLNYKLTKQGNGSLTLNGSSTYNGGFELFAGQVNLGNSYCLGLGVCTIDAGSSIDNYSGADLMVFPISYVWSGSFSYLGTSNNLDLSSGTVQVVGGGNYSVNIVTNTLITEGNIIPGNSVLHKTGQGTWDIAGFGSSAQNLNLSVDQGTVKLDKAIGQSINGVAFGLLVQSNALAIITGSSVDQIADNNSVAVSTGGVLDLYGHSETVGSFTNNNGVLRNSLAGSTSSLTNGTATLTGTNCVFDVTDSAGVLNISAIVVGSGSLVKTGLGLLNLAYTNTYTGDTIINAGTLELNAPCLTNTSTVTISNGAVLNLNFANADTNQVAALILNGTNQPNGRYNATTASGYITGSGSLLVGPPVTINPLPGSIQFSVSGSTLALSWPTNLGWILQSHTNALNVNSNAWFDMPGSSSSTFTNITINPANPTEFYRLRSP